MRRIYQIGALFIIGFFLLTPAVFAQDGITLEETTQFPDINHQKSKEVVKQKKEELIEARELKKVEIAKKIESRINLLNQKMIARMENRLTRMENLILKIETRTEKIQPETNLTDRFTSIKTQMEALKARLDEQKTKTYSTESSSSVRLKIEIKSLHKKIVADFKSLNLALVNIKKDIAKLLSIVRDSEPEAQAASPSAF